MEDTPTENTSVTNGDTARAQAPQVVHISRSLSPIKPEVSAEIQAKHEASMRMYPTLNLSEGEYVISAVKRHWIGLITPIAVTIFLIAITMALAIIYPQVLESQSYNDHASEQGSIFTIAALLSFLFAVGGYMAVWVYGDNRFFLTNESVIQEIRYGIFTKREQTVSLANIEDASFIQRGLIETLLDYGSIRLSTQGDETTYRFGYVTNPKKEIALLNNAVEDFKNGRPVDD